MKRILLFFLCFIMVLGAAASDAATPTDLSPERKVLLCSSLEEGQPVYYGDEILLWFELIGFEGYEVTFIQWEESLDGIEFFPIEDANEPTYLLIITPENAKHFWRVVVTVGVIE